MKIHTRPLTEIDIKQIHQLFLTDAPNEWNYLTQDSIDSQFQLIKDGKATAVLAEDNEIAGFAVLIFKEACPEYLNQYAKLSSIAYINDVVVSKHHSGKGIGSKLLQKAVGIAKDNQCAEVYIERHEENLASAGMMRKADFDIVNTFFDPEKRTAGSRKTSILCKKTGHEI